MDDVVWQFFISFRSAGLTTWVQWWSEIFRPRWVTVGAAVAGIVFLARNRGGQLLRALFPVAAIGLATTATHLLKPLIGRPRPPEELRLVGEVTYAMPSGHATGVAALATVLTLLAAGRHWLVWIAWLNAVLVMATRLYLGVHWVSDVAVGALFGVVISLLVWWGLGRWGPTSLWSDRPVGRAAATGS